MVDGAIVMIENVHKHMEKTNLTDENRWQVYLATVPTGRAAHVREIADVVAFLASERASWVTGTVINLDGGQANR